MQTELKTQRHAAMRRHAAMGRHTAMRHTAMRHATIRAVGCSSILLIALSCGKTSDECLTQDCLAPSEGTGSSGSGAEGTGAGLDDPSSEDPTSTGGEWGLGGEGSGGNPAWDRDAEVAFFEPGMHTCTPGGAPAPEGKIQGWQLDGTIRDLLGVRTLGEHDEKKPSEVLRIGSTNVEQSEGYAEFAEIVAQESGGYPLLEDMRSCGEKACLEESFRRFCSRAFRKAVSDEDLFFYLPDFPIDEGTEQQVAIDSITRILSSRAFWFRNYYADTTDSAGNHLLSGRQMAIRLAYFLWGTFPDDALYALADAGELETDEQIRIQAERMLSDRRGREAIADFHAQYAQGFYDRSWKTDFRERDPDLFGDYTKAVYDSAREATYIFFDHITYSGGTFDQLFLSNDVYVNEHLAPFYGLDSSDFGNAFQRVQLDPEQRPGFLTRVDFLSTFSGYDWTVPSTRGYVVMSGVLGIDTGQSEAYKDFDRTGYETIREFLFVSTSAPSCLICHQGYIDGPGLVLEHYDPLGRWRTTDDLGGTIDPVADVHLGSEYRTITSPRQLMEELAASPRAHRHYVDRLILRAFERSSEMDACLAEDLAQRLGSRELSLHDLWLEIASSLEFRRGRPTDG